MRFQYSLRSVASFAIAVTMLASLAAPANAQIVRSAVGGVMINAQGVLSQPTAAANRELAQMMRDTVPAVEGEMNELGMRRISLRQLSEAINESQANNTELPAEMRYLAGMQRVQYVFVYPEQNDIVIAGPGEGWEVNESGDVVGRTTRQPVVQLEDLLVALQSSQQAREVGISCSIDPTEEGVRRMESLVRKQSRYNARVLPAIEKAMGAQQIKLTGIPHDSHFARVLVAADYRMKRIAMHLEQSPLRELPSFLSMMKNSRTKVTNMMPRWWMACDYEPMARTDDGMGWEIRGPGVKVMTELDFVAEDGSRESTGRKLGLAQKWADRMTENYEELSAKSPIFGQLRNAMDLCVVAAVIDKHDLAEAAGCDLSALTDSSSVLGRWHAPKTVSTQCSVTKRGRDYLITASGGVQIESWQVADRAEVDAKLSTVYTKAAESTGTWWK